VVSLGVFVAKELSMVRRVAFERGSFAVLVAALASILVGVPLTAQEVVGGKIGVFDADRIMAESQPGQQALALFNQLRDQRVRELQVQQDQINVLQQQAIAVTPGSPDAVRLNREVENGMLRLQRLQEDVEQELGVRQQELTTGIMSMIGQTIEVMGEEEGYTLIFNQIQSGLVYVGPTLDITDELIRRVNALAAPSGL
jgi:Skp family chaperone for outer membrane proteins